MFSEIKNGSIENVQGLECWIPPVGYIVDFTTCKTNPITQMLDLSTGTLRKIGVYQRRPHYTDCFWEIDPRWALLPLWRKEEAKHQQTNINYKHPDLAKFIQECWLYRLGGFWYYNNNVPTYITGAHWFHLSCINMDTGLPKYRNEDRLIFYHWQYCFEDPLCYGQLLLTKRRYGKTFYAGGLAIEMTTRNEQFNSGIQSKEEKSAKKAYRKAIIGPYRKLPYFFQVKKSNILKSERELRFIGKDAEDLDDELDSKIDFQTAAEIAYDGDKLKFYYADEIGKPQEVDINDRWDVVQWCLKDSEGNVIGKSAQTTTVEDMDGSADAFLKMWDGSNQNDKIEGRTITGLYRYFVSSIKVRELDKYGFANEEAARAKIMSGRKAKQADPRKLSAEIRKEPITIEEAFQTDSQNCPFNPILLNDRDTFLTFAPGPLYEKGKLQWVDNVRYGAVEFVPDPNGRFLIAEHPPEHLRNNKIMKGRKAHPANNASYAGGVDTYDHDFIVDKGRNRRLSDGSITIRKKPGTPFSTEFDNGPVLFYLARRDSSSDFYEECIMAAIYYGCALLIETNKPGCDKEFAKCDLEAYSATLPGASERGLNTIGKSNKFLFELTDTFISHHVNTVVFPRLIKDWLKFDASRTTEFDAAMSFGLASILMYATEVRGEKKSNTKDIGSILPFYKNRRSYA